MKIINNLFEYSLSLNRNTIYIVAAFVYLSCSNKLYAQKNYSEVGKRNVIEKNEADRLYAQKSYNEIQDNNITKKTEDGVEFCGNVYDKNETDVFCSASIKDLSPLIDLPEIRSLKLIRTNISDLTPIKKLVKLENLELKNKSVVDLKPLEGLQNLKSVSIDDTPVVDYRPLLSFSAGRDLCLIAHSDFYCDENRPGKPTQHTIDLIIDKTTRIRVLEVYKTRNHIVGEVELGRLDPSILKKRFDLPLVIVLYESKDVKEIKNLKRLLKIKENEKWISDNYPGNPKIEFYSDELLIASLILNQGKRMQLEISKKNNIINKFWNGDAVLKNPKLLDNWLKKIEKKKRIGVGVVPPKN